MLSHYAILCQPECFPKGSRFKVQGSRFKVQGSRFKGKDKGQALKGQELSQSLFVLTTLDIELLANSEFGFPISALELKPPHYAVHVF